jgi:hypothetical protein
MRLRVLGAALLVASASLASAKDVYLSVGGSVGNFRTDARIFNPSYDKDITIVARYLPSGNNDNSAIVPKSITVAKRTMAVYDDVVQSLFGGGPALGAVRLTSDDDFSATQRIYANEAIGTLGQFVPGLDASAALRKGVVLQLKNNGARGTKGTFRTNWGGVNPNATVANIEFTLYDKTNGVAGTTTLTLQPYGVFSPTSLSGFFGNPNRDLSDAWLQFSSDQPIFIYGSVLDNGSEDPTFITASEDPGVAPPAPTIKTVTITARNWEYDVAMSAPLRAGDVVDFRISSAEDTHGFELVGPNGQTLISEQRFSGSTLIERRVTLTAGGVYTFFCLYSLCGEGHSAMNGQFDVVN